MNYKEFFEKLGNPEPKCWADYSIKIEAKDIPKYADKYDITFIPNVGGRTNEEITEYKAFWVDLDAGKEKIINSNGKEEERYLPGKKVKAFKSKQWEKINKFKFQPNFVCETRNGYHLFWILKEKISRELWYKIEHALADYFNSDSSVCIPSKQMRVPGTMWRKYPDQPYPCKILQYNDTNTYIASFCKLFNITESNESTASKNMDENAKPTTPKNKQLYEIRPLPTTPRVFTNYKQTFDYLTQEVSMFAYLQKYHGLEGNNPRSFCCLIHNDTHPSGSIFKVDSGLELYCCNATSCGFKGNIIQVVAKLDNCSRSEAFYKICKNLKVEYKVDSKLEELLNDNINTLNDDILYSHTDLYSSVRHYLTTLKELHSLAKDRLEFAETENKFMFSASIQYITERLGKSDKKKTTTDIGFLSLLKLIEKVDLDTDSDVPKKYEKYIRRFQGDKENYITVFSIPYYSHNKLNECEDVAKQIKAKGLRKAHFSYETVVNAFGRETADRVFPQIKGKRVKSIDRFLVQAMEILLEKDGYFTLNTIKSFYRDNEVFFREKTYIRQLPAIMKMLGLEKKKASKKIKEQYGILSAGYPIIFTKKGN